MGFVGVHEPYDVDCKIVYKCTFYDLHQISKATVAPEFFLIHTCIRSSTESSRPVEYFEFLSVSIFLITMSFFYKNLD